MREISSRRQSLLVLGGGNWFTGHGKTSIFGDYLQKNVNEDAWKIEACRGSNLGGVTRTVCAWRAAVCI